MEGVEVVGSRIPRAEGEGAVPVTVVDRARIEASGATRIAELLARLPYFSFGGFDDRVDSVEFLNGSSALSLRGLGPSATLVLLNGRRLVPYGVALEDGGAFVDLNSLPLAAVERIEILRDGASAIYGADALAGVVNIVLREDFSGVEAAVSSGARTRGDARRRSASLAAGRGRPGADRFNVFGVAEVLSQEGLPSTARRFARSADQRANGGSDNREREGSPPTLRFPGGAYEPAPGCPADRIRAATPGPGEECAFDPALFSFLTPDVARADVLLVGKYRLPAVSVFLEASAGRTRTTRQFSPAPASVRLPAEAATNPFGRAVDVFFRVPEAGPRSQRATVDADRVVAGASDASGGWDWEIAGGVNRIGTDLRLTGHLRRAALETAVRSEAFDPLSTTRDPRSVEPLKVATRDRFDSELRFVQARVGGELARLAHGPLGAVFGVETRRERFSTRLDPATRSGDIAGESIVLLEDGGAARRVSAAFAETSARPWEAVEVRLAARFDRYPVFGGELSPKATIGWQAAPAWSVRLSAGRGFLPPALYQIHQPPYAQEEEIRDPSRCPVTRLADDCVRTVPYYLAGNRALQPERSRQASGGLAWAPDEATSFSLDAWQVDHRNKITLAEEHFLEQEALFPGHVIRAPAAPADVALGIPGPIVGLRDAYINLARRSARGIDVEARIARPLPGLGKLTLVGMTSWQRSFRSQLAAGAPFAELAGSDGRPRMRAQVTAAWEAGAWEAEIAWRHVGGYRYEDAVAARARRAASWSPLDLHASWRAPGGVRLALTVTNLFDRDPPYRSDRAAGYDAHVHDPLGRTFLASVRLTF